MQKIYVVVATLAQGILETRLSQPVAFGFSVGAPASPLFSARRAAQAAAAEGSRRRSRSSPSSPARSISMPAAYVRFGAPGVSAGSLGGW